MSDSVNQTLNKPKLVRSATDSQLGVQNESRDNATEKLKSLSSFQTNGKTSSEPLNKMQESTIKDSPTYQSLMEEADNAPAVLLWKIISWFFDLEEEKKSENQGLAEFIANLGKTEELTGIFNDKENVKKAVDLIDDEQKLKDIKAIEPAKDKTARELVVDIESKIKKLKGGSIKKGGKYSEAIKDIKKTESKYNKISNEQDPKRIKYNFINELTLKTNEAIAQAKETFKDNSEALKRAEKNIYESFKNQMENSGYSEGFGKAGTFGNDDKQYFKKIQDNYNFEKEDSRVQDKIKKLNEKLNEVSDKFSDKYSELQKKTDELEKRKNLIKGINDVKVVDNTKNSPLKDITSKPTLSPTIIADSRSKIMGFKTNQGNNQP